MMQNMTSNSNTLHTFQDGEKYQECLKKGHEWEYCQTNIVDIDTVEIVWFCGNCSHTSEEYMFREEYERGQISI